MGKADPFTIPEKDQATDASKPVKAASNPLLLYKIQKSLAPTRITGSTGRNTPRMNNEI